MVLQICGGVGSGKSLVLAYLKENYGASIVGMDELAHELYEPGEAGYLRALELMGGGDTRGGREPRSKGDGKSTLSGARPACRFGCDRAPLGL